jgi:hypothetical protein
LVVNASGFVVESQTHLGKERRELIRFGDTEISELLRGNVFGSIHEMIAVTRLTLPPSVNFQAP